MTTTLILVHLFTHESNHLVDIDNHGSGYLGMARPFNVHRQLPVLKKNRHISAQR